MDQKNHNCTRFVRSHLFVSGWLLESKGRRRSRGKVIFFSDTRRFQRTQRKHLLQMLLSEEEETLLSLVSSALPCYGCGTFFIAPFRHHSEVGLNNKHKHKAAKRQNSSTSPSPCSHALSSPPRTRIGGLQRWVPLGE